MPGAEEMVLDTYRNRSKKGNLNKQLSEYIFFVVCSSMFVKVILVFVEAFVIITRYEVVFSCQYKVVWFWLTFMFY